MKVSKKRRVSDQPSDSAEIPEGMVRLSKYITDTMDFYKLTINTVSINSNPKNPDNRIDPVTVWRIKNLKNNNVEDRTLILLAKGLSVSPDTLRAIYLGTINVNSTIRPVELDNKLWTRLEQSALANRRIMRTTETQLPDISSELAALLDKHLPALKKERKAS